MKNLRNSYFSPKGVFFINAGLVNEVEAQKITFGLIESGNCPIEVIRFNGLDRFDYKMKDGKLAFGHLNDYAVWIDGEFYCVIDSKRFEDAFGPEVKNDAGKPKE